MDDFDKIIKKIISIFKFDISNDRLNYYKNYVQNINDNIIIEKNVSNNYNNKEYSFGNYFIDKENLSSSFISNFDEDFINKYMNNDFKIFINFITKITSDSEIINKYLTIIYDILFEKIKYNEKNILSFIISDS